MKKIFIIVSSSLYSFVALGLIISTFFIKNASLNKKIIIISLVSVIIIKFVEVFKVKETRISSIVTIIILISLLVYYLSLIHI